MLNNKLKCKICNKKLSLIRSSIICKCPEKYFCELHFNNHNCEYDYKKDYEIYKKIEPIKLDKI